MIAEFDNINYDVSELNSFAFQMLVQDCKQGLVDCGITEKPTLASMQTPLPQELLFKNLDKSQKLVYNEIITKCEQYSRENYELLSRLTYYSDIEDLNDIEFYVERTWINFQRPGEFIPVHRHSGVFSFVIWVQVPYSLTEDTGSEQFSASKNVKGNFEFIYNDILGNLRTCRIPADKDWEGKLMIFPAELHHQVYPFYSNDFRITVSGNIRARKR